MATAPGLLRLGAKARDQISGWHGTLTCRYTYLNGCVRWEISGHDKEGKPESFVFDAEQIEVLEERAGVFHRDKSARAATGATGGPRDNRPVSDNRPVAR